MSREIEIGTVGREEEERAEIEDAIDGASDQDKITYLLDGEGKRIAAIVPAEVAERHERDIEEVLATPVGKAEPGKERRCPDDGKCHHGCTAGCFRVHACGPLSGAYPGDRWPDEVREQQQQLDEDGPRRAAVSYLQLQQKCPWCKCGEHDRCRRYTAGTNPCFCEDGRHKEYELEVAARMGLLSRRLR